MNTKFFTGSFIILLTSFSFISAMNPDTNLIRAINENDLKKVEEAISNGANLDFGTAQGKAVLNAANKKTQDLEAIVKDFKHANKYSIQKADLGSSYDNEENAQKDLKTASEIYHTILNKSAAQREHEIRDLINAFAGF